MGSDQFLIEAVSLYLAVFVYESRDVILECFPFLKKSYGPFYSIRAIKQNRENIRFVDLNLDFEGNTSGCQK